MIVTTAPAEEAPKTPTPSTSTEARRDDVFDAVEAVDYRSTEASSSAVNPAADISERVPVWSRRQFVCTAVRASGGLKETKKEISLSFLSV